MPAHDVAAQHMLICAIRAYDVCTCTHAALLMCACCLHAYVVQTLLALDDLSVGMC